jgi:hypothetical protein
LSLCKLSFVEHEANQGSPARQKEPPYDAAKIRRLRIEPERAQMEKSEEDAEGKKDNVGALAERGSGQGYEQADNHEPKDSRQPLRKNGFESLGLLLRCA